MAVELTWLSHASFRLAAGGRVVYIDPWKIEGAPHDADLVIVSHEHYDHLSPDDIAKVSRADTEILASTAAVARLGRGHAASPNQTVTLAGIEVRTLPAYNPAKRFHPLSAGGLGVVIALGGLRIYYAGDTDLIEEMGRLEHIDVALLPVGGTYTMNAAEAAQAARRITPAVAIPYHFGDIVGTLADAEAFANAGCPVKILQPGKTAVFGE
ncbi:MAG: MBL fold metallo-hydrolase [Planctomycetes bacterium]|nr:MBL fold metallo-hydrolase [Planctomycetota bacterium]